ncbi:MAG: DUF1015 domain-containing protein [Clostridia bacterium]|nr:DUF1015 domain-containing protein [Clostridia bacterium]
MENLSKKLGVHVPAILLPAKKVDLSKWAVVACDQYTSQPEYWRKVEELVGNDESTLHMIFPEVYLEVDGKEERISKINKTMEQYLEENVLVPQKPGFIYVDRKTTHAASRKGLIIAVDLEMYDYNKGSQTLIRATEGTVLDRLPPRIKVREKACLELPHIMVLIDDRDRTVIEPIADKAGELEKLYDIDLMMDGMSIKGYKVDHPEMVENILNALNRLADPQVFKDKYGLEEEQGVLLFAVGDGNHSLATAKACWENLKKELKKSEIEDHPARYALVEVVNIHDEGLSFEPIHRVAFDIDTKNMLEHIAPFFVQQGSEAFYKTYESKACMEKDLEDLKKDAHVIPFVTADSLGAMVVKNPKCNIAVGTLQAFLDDYLKQNSQARVDYIHGDDVVTELGIKEGNIGFYLPPMDKQALFKTIILDGVLTKKTFSMGEAEEKRFYLECRKIRKD